MNDLGLAFLWCAAQITLVTMPAAALHLWASRRGPVAGAWVAAAGLVTIVFLTLLACFPPPSRVADRSKPWAPESARPADAGLPSARIGTSSPQATDFTL